MNSLLLQIDELAKSGQVDESHLFDLIAEVGSDVNGLRLLVDRYDQASNWRVLGCIAVLLSRTAWDQLAARDTRGLILDFIETARAVPEAGTLISALNALHGLEVSEALGTPDVDQQASVAAFLLHCLNHPDANVQAAVVDVLAHLWQAEALLRDLPDATSAPLQVRLAELASAGMGGEAERDLGSLEEFWHRE